MRNNQWIFTKFCGCPVGVAEQEGLDETAREAMVEMYGTETAADQAEARGTTATLITFDEYLRDYADRMTERCSHGVEEPTP